MQPRGGGEGGGKVSAHFFFCLDKPNVVGGIRSYSSRLALLPSLPLPLPLSPPYFFSRSSLVMGKANKVQRFFWSNY